MFSTVTDSTDMHNYAKQLAHLYVSDAVKQLRVAKMGSSFISIVKELKIRYVCCKRCKTFVDCIRQWLSGVTLVQQVRQSLKSDENKSMKG